MGRLQSLIPLFVIALVGSSTGCMTTKQNTSSVLETPKPATTAEKIGTTLKDAVSLTSTKPAHASEFQCAWQTKLGQLPDPTRNGAMVSGIVGQVFIYTDKYQPAEVQGSLTIVANDATTRPQGMPPRQPNVWHLDPETLKKLTVYDERFGKSLALFLPWPEEWTDVNRLSIQARYDQTGTHTLYAQQSTVTLDFHNTGNQVTHSQSRTSTPAMMAQVPDPKVFMNQLKATPTPTGLSQQQQQMIVNQAAFTGPAPNGVPVSPVGWNPPQTGVPVPPASVQPQMQEFQRMVIPRK